MRSARREDFVAIASVSVTWEVTIELEASADPFYFLLIRYAQADAPMIRGER